MYSFEGHELTVVKRLALKHIMLYLQTGHTDYTINVDTVKELSIKEQVWIQKATESIKDIKQLNCNFNSFDEAIGWMLIHIKREFEQTLKETTVFAHPLEERVFVTVPIDEAITLIQTVIDIRLHSMNNKNKDNVKYNHPVYRAITKVLEEQRARDKRIELYKEVMS
ncbi:hypothetical protein [Bacillus phage Hakuna]|uniref:Uncharacterized protein n=2 Tax=Wphvirus TaxID=1922327 RepID=A0A024B2B2_9CAUD|nr:hypothetical protein FP72_gp293 [Bacillus phage Hakuna]YP_009281100.1 hypothetical protein SAGEFAYGE_297 [Bacillus phage SageFayge]AHZ10311.1 hypothetical protein [Bacillus phage Hakuna]AMW63217.1 hypothetical protein SAGEFAYGE_297 [Bacillus phage SageFayge]